MKQRVVIVALFMALATLWFGHAAAKPRVSVVAVNAQAAENGSVNGQFQLVSDATVSKPLTVSYTIGGSAKMGADYKKIKLKATIPAGQNTIFIDVIPVADKKAEKKEVVKLILKKGRNYLRGNARTASIQITDKPASGAAGSFPTYQNTTLPGQMLVGIPGDLNIRAAIFNLSNGSRVNLPKTEQPNQDEWAAGASGSSLVRQTTGKYNNSYFSFFDVANLVVNKPSLDLNISDIYSGHAAKLSPDGRYLLTYRDGGVGDNMLAIFDSATGTVVKSGSNLDGMTVTSTPATWLPDGRYVYLADTDLYISSPTSVTEQLVAQLTIPSFSPFTSASEMAVSPDGRQLAFNMPEGRNGLLTDKQIWVVNIDGTGLRRLTSVPDPTSPLEVKYSSPSWSPDGQWVAGVLERSGSDSASNSGTGTTGCISQVLVFPASANNVAATPFPTYDATYGVKVAPDQGNGAAQWLSSCNALVNWLP